jgi:hypothetical protein
LETTKGDGDAIWDDDAAVKDSHEIGKSESMKDVPNRLPQLKKIKLLLTDRKIWVNRSDNTPL